MEFTEQLRVGPRSGAPGRDIGTGDLTARLIAGQPHGPWPGDHREDAILCGSRFDAAFMALTRRLGDLARPRRRAHQARPAACRIDASARALLTAGAPASHFVQLLSGTATMTATYVQAVAGTRARSSTPARPRPGLRLAQKYAVASAAAPTTASASTTAS